MITKSEDGITWLMDGHHYHTTILAQTGITGHSQLYSLIMTHDLICVHLALPIKLTCVTSVSLIQQLLCPVLWLAHQEIICLETPPSPWQCYTVSSALQIHHEQMECQSTSICSDEYLYAGYYQHDITLANLLHIY